MRYDFVGWTFNIIKFIWRRKHPVKKFDPDYIGVIPMLLELNTLNTNIKGATNGREESK